MFGLVIGSLVVMIVHQVFAGALDSSSRLDEARAAHARIMRAREMLTLAFGSLKIGVDGSGGFAGSSRRVEFTTERQPNESAVRRTTLTVLAIDRGWLTLASAGRLDSLLAVQDAAFDSLLSYGAQADRVQ